MSNGEERAPSQGPTRWRPLSELELLISGAVIFTLYRIPGWLQAVFLYIDSRVGEDLFMFPFLFYYFANLLALALVVAFSVHFLLRSFWVAIAGLNQVFPQGIDWSKLDLSPIALKVAKSFGPTAELQRKLDRAASTVFSILFFISLQTFFLAIAMGLVVALLLPLKRLLAPALPEQAFLFLVFLVLFAPPLLSTLVDRWFKTEPSRLEERPRLAAWVERVLRFHHRVLFSGLYQPIQLTFASHTSNRATVVASLGAVAVMLLLFLTTFLLGTGQIGFDSFTYFPEVESPLSVDPGRYENLGGGDAQTPTVDRDVVDGPYLRLFIPYLPRRDGGVIAERCPDIEPLREEGFFRRDRMRRLELEPGQAARLLRCVASLYRLELNGLAVELELSFYRHPESGVRGLRAYLPTAGLPAGRNVLAVHRPPSARELEEAEDAEERRWLERRGTAYLPFWK